MKSLLNLKLSEKLVYLGCLYYAQKNHNMFTYKDLDFLGLPDQTISRACNKLKKKEYLILFKVKNKVLLVVL